jgi:predicted nucleic acid-binding protein
MILYLDTSSLVKVYVKEVHSELVREWFEVAEVIATSRVCFAEAMSAFARRRAQGELDDDQFELVSEMLSVHWSEFILLPVRERKAGALAVKHLLRGFDAIHLAAASELPSAFRDEPVLFSSFDIRLLGAARAERLDTLHLSSRDGLVMEEIVEYG